MIHREITNDIELSQESPNLNVNTVYQNNKEVFTLLPTAIALIMGANNMYYPCRILLDTGSQVTLISEACVQRLNLKRSYDKTLLCGAGGEPLDYTRGKVEMVLKSYISNNIIKASALCLKRLTQLQPALAVSETEVKYFRNLPLADPNCTKPNQIDVILGANLFNEYFLQQRIIHPSGALSAFNTIFGWAIIGNVSMLHTSTTTIAHTSIALHDQLQQFWNIEEVQDHKEFLTEEEQQAEKHYQQTVTRDETGRYMVRLPLKSSTMEFGDTKKQALRRMYNMESRFKSNNDLQLEYTTFMEEYIQLKHMECLTTNERAKYYLPHHAVLKGDSTTTKLRVVFDGSAKGTDGTSLNEQLLIGANFQPDIFTILLQFRKYKFAISADIAKMYRQILIHPQDRAYQCIFWRANTTSNMSTYQLRTITYGTSAAPFLAVRTLKQISIDIQQQRPAIAELIQQSFYVDDFMSSVQDLKVAISIRQELTDVLSQAGMHLRKWCSNSEEILQTINDQDKELSKETIIDDTQTVKTLGLYWNTHSDVFKYSVRLPEQQNEITKRVVLSIISRVFDPLGCLAPVIITLKIFMQRLWLKGIDWDSPLPNDLSARWENIYESIKNVSDFQVPRWLQYSNESQAELHGFADSSELAYAAVVYLKIKHNNGEITTHLIAAKSRVAPVKQITLPRLELCGCQLLIRLITKVKNALQIENLKVHAWTDSTIVLAWLAEHPRKWKNFIANRTSFIINILPAQYWHYVPSAMNPADLATRGLSTDQLKTSNLWWYGPRFLLDNEYSKFKPGNSVITDVEIRKNAVFHIDNSHQYDIFYRYSQLSKLIRITATLLRFFKNSKQERGTRQTGFLTTIELQAAHNTLVKRSQQMSFNSEFQLLTKDNQLPKNHPLSSLAPFIANGVIRVGGRLGLANIPYDQKHPVILHKDHVLTQLIIQHYHLKHMHAGSRQLQYLLGLKYYIPSVVYLIKRCVYKCPQCMRYRNKPYEQQMGNLPRSRIEAVSAFYNTGVDYAGPMLIRSWRGRGSRRYKCWIAVFVCLATKAIHLEAVTELTTDAFIVTLRRFVARRGKPANIHSDNGTNFIGCNNKLKELLKFMHENSTQEAITRETAEQGIQWHFSPPFGPNFGGLWEAGVKSVKFHLNRVLGQSAVTFEELYTILCQIEAFLNSRPLSAKFEGDPEPLTPAHFLICKSMETVPDHDFTNININRLTRWQYLQQLVQTFWRKWSEEYLSQLQARQKWKLKLQNLKLNDLVFIKDELSPPCKWRIGKIIETHPGPDGLVRVVTIKTQTNTVKRPITKLCPLIVDI